jgi:proteasome alpha subunit
MAMSFYVPWEQQERDRAEFARRGISRGRSVAAVEYTDGVLFVADNPSSTLYKLSEIYDRIAFAAVGRYAEYEQLRVSGIQTSEVRGFQYAREDVNGRSLANAYASALRSAFSESPKPLEVELLVAEVTDDEVELYHILYDGSITDEQGSVAIGGTSETVNGRLKERYRAGLTLAEALRTAHEALSDPANGPISPERLEVAGLDRTRGRRKFFRFPKERLSELLAEGGAPT